MLRINGLSCGMVLALGTLAHAQEPAVETTTTATTTPAGTTEVRRASQLIGSNVALQGQDNFGKIEDIVLNESGAPDYLVVSNGGQYAMLPFHAAKINYGQRVVTYDVTPQAVQPLFFAQNAWPNMSDQKYTTRMHRLFPRARALRREGLRPVEGAIPIPEERPEVVKEKVKVKNNGDVKIKERVR